MVRNLDKVANHASHAHTPYVNLGDYHFTTPSPSRLASYEVHKWDQAVHQLSPFFSATFDLDVPSYKDVMTNDGTSILSWLHPEPSPASLMPIDNNDVISIHSGQAKASEFYADAKAFYKEEYEKEIPFEEYFNLNGGAKEDKYIFSLFMHPVVQYLYLPQYVDYILSSVVDSQ